jgi:RNA polymerase sigma-70 factor (ECF subfamily)
VANDDIARILRAEAGDLRAFEQILLELEPQLRVYLRRLVAEQPSVDDILQECLFRLWRGLPWLREPTLFRAWAYRIATREAYRAMKRERKIEESRADATELEALPAPFTDPAAKLDAERCLAQVSPLARATLVAHYFEGLSLEEVGAVTGAPFGAVKSRLASGLAQLRQRIGEVR